jgi:hypothetical protein
MKKEKQRKQAEIVAIRRKEKRTRGKKTKKSRKS